MRLTCQSQRWWGGSGGNAGRLWSRGTKSRGSTPVVAGGDNIDHVSFICIVITCLLQESDCGFVNRLYVTIMWEDIESSVKVFCPF